MIAVLAVVGAFCMGFVVWSCIAIGGKKRSPEIYSAVDLKEWSISEKALVGLLEGRRSMWRPARPCGIFGIAHLSRRLFTSWRVFCGDLDAVRWGERSGEAKNDGTNYRDAFEERDGMVKAFGTVPDGFTEIRMIPEFQGVKGAPKVGVAGTFILQGSEAVIQAVDIEALRRLVKAMGIDLDDERVAEVMVLPTRKVKMFENIGPTPPGVRPAFPGMTTGVTQ